MIPPSAQGLPDEQEMACPDCLGRGTSGSQICPRCKGSKEEPPERKPTAGESVALRQSKVGTHLKWMVPVLGIVVVVGVLGYLKFFAWNPERQKLAVIDDRMITVAQFERELAKIPPPFQEVLKEEPREFLDQMILKEVLLKEARRQGLKGEPVAKDEDQLVSHPESSQEGSSG